MNTITLPGLIDPHVHLREPGQTEKEDFLTGTQAALAGGFTTVIDMPNNSDPITTHEKLEAKRALAREKTVADIGFHFGTLGDNLDEFRKVSGKVKGLKIYLNHTTGDFIIDQSKLINIFQAWPAENGPILLHAEEEKIKDVIHAIKQTGKRAHICHISSQAELSYVMEAKEQGVPITCGVTPHHLFLSQEDEKHLGTQGMMKPVLKEKKDVEFLWKHLAAIDIVESDHAPHTSNEKQGQTPHFGVPGLETTLPLLLTAVSQNRLTIVDVIRLCFEGSSQIFNITTDDQTLVFVDPYTTYEIKNEHLFTKCKWSPFNGWKVKGKVMEVKMYGKTVFTHGEILALPGSETVVS